MAYEQKRPKGSRTLVHQGQTYYWQVGKTATKIYGPDKSRTVHNANLVRIPSMVFERARFYGVERHGAVQPHHVASYIEQFWNQNDPDLDQAERVDAQKPQYEQVDPTSAPDYQPYDPWDRFDD